MIDIYTERKDSKDWIFYNDLYFNLNTGNEDMSQKEIDLIQQVDEAKLTPDKHVSKLPEDKIYVLIRKHYIRYSLSNTEKIKSNAIDGFGIYCREYIDQFINDLPSVSLNESEVVMLLNDTTIDKHFKPKILKKISAGIITKKLAQTIASNQFDVDKEYVERAWKFLDNTERHMLLVYHLQVYSVAEISRLLMELGGEWSKLSDNKSRHKEEISIDVNGHNERLLLQLQKKGFITSYQEKNDRKKGN